MADGEYFRYDVNGGQHPNQQDRHSPAALDEGYGGPEQCPKRPEKLFLPRQGSVDYTRFEKIFKKAGQYNTISELPYHIREEVGDNLNIEKENRSDWRGLASRMGEKPTTIDKIEKKYKENPTKQLFQEMSGKKTTQLVQVLYQMDRNDVLNVFHEYLCIKSDDDTQPISAGEKRGQYQSSKFPSQESTPVSGNSSTSEFCPTTPKSPSKDSGTPESSDRSDSGWGSSRSQPTSRTKRGSFAKQNTDEDLRSRSSKSSLDFHSKESKQFWYGIPPQPDSTRKEWREVEEEFKKKFEKESRLSQVMRFICYVLKIEPYEERHNKFVHDRDFANLVAWFGPVKSGKNGLFSKIAELIKNSTTYKERTGPHSFFAGYMTKDEADAVIGAAEQVGTFLIRFSSTFAEEGSFVVVLKTHNDTEHIKLKGNPDTGKITYKDKDYDDLIALYRRGLCKGGVSYDERVSCTTICPNLPLNAMFKPYGPAPRPSSSAGRGRGRGRSQEQ